MTRRPFAHDCIWDDWAPLAGTLGLEARHCAYGHAEVRRPEEK